MIKCIIPENSVVERNGRNGVYFTQTVDACICGSDNKPMRHPVELNNYLAKTRDEAMKKSLPPGDYTIAPSSIGVDRGNLVIKWLNLIPLKQANAKG